jgi:hypothetical protein
MITALSAVNNLLPAFCVCAPAAAAAAVTETPFTLASISGKGCEGNDALLGQPYACASTMLANVTDITGPVSDCTYPGEVRISFHYVMCALFTAKCQLTCIFRCVLLGRLSF